jgi:hypothetical protein
MVECADSGVMHARKRKRYKIMIEKDNQSPIEHRAESGLSEFAEHGVYRVERGVNLFPDLKRQNNGFSELSTNGGPLTDQGRYLKRQSTSAKRPTFHQARWKAANE